MWFVRLLDRTCCSSIRNGLQRRVIVVVVVRKCLVILAVDVATGSGVVVVETAVGLGRCF